MVDIAVFVAFFEGIVVEFAADFMKVRWKHSRFPGLTDKQTRRVLKEAAKDAGKMLRKELPSLPDDEWEAALTAVHDSLEAVRPIGISDALAAELRPDNFEDHVRDASIRVRATAHLSEAGEAAYDRILTVTCEQLIRFLQRVRGVQKHVQFQTFRDVREQGHVLDEIRALLLRDAGAADEFERRYREHVVRTLGRLEVFGVTRGRRPRRYAFKQAYVDLAVARSGGSGGGSGTVGVGVGGEVDDLTGAGVDAGGGLADHRRVLLRGGAGAGKTTLLQWLAVKASEDPVWGEPVPFFVPLRQFARTALPAPEELPKAVADVLLGEMPQGWVSAQLRSGRALVLVDGIDELAPKQREAARTWLENLITAYSGNRFIVSARPFAIPEDWLDGSDFATFDLLPLSPGGVEALVAAWHRAARREHSSKAQQAWLRECEESLVAEVKGQVELRRLASSPLLCGLLCALNLEHGMQLPRDRKGLYEAALDLLLVRWDQQRGVRIKGWPPLSRDQQVVLLQRFAATMVENNELVISKDDAAQRISHAMRGLSPRRSGSEKVLQRTLERTGLLREPVPDRVQFVHRTFRDFLAAKEMVDAGKLLGFLVMHAHEDYWHDVVLNAVAHARAQERDEFLRKLLDNGDAAAETDPVLRNQLHLVAAACLPHADALASDKTRERVEGAAARLIPPATFDQAEMLARAGSFVLALLPGPEGLTTHEAACVVRTAAMVGGEGVWEKLAEFVPLGESRVIDELLRAWRRWDDPEVYAREVLADVDFGDRRLEVRSWRRIACLPHLKHLTDVACYGNFADLTPLAAIPRLRRLELVQNGLVRDLGPLVENRTLRSLYLTAGGQFLRDLSPLARTAIDELDLRMIGADLGTLTGMRLRRLVVRDHRLADGLDRLPADLPLRELVVTNLATSRNLRGVERWPELEHVSVNGMPELEELDALAKLPALAHLSVHGPEVIADLARLDALPALRELDVHVADDQASAVQVATRGLRDVVVRVHITAAWDAA